MPNHTQRIFESLVSNNEDIEGIIAFGIYTLREREWVEEHGRSGEDREPSHEELESFSRTYTKGALDSLRKQARDSLSEFAFGVFQERIEQERKKAVDESILSRIEEEFRKFSVSLSFIRSLLTNTLSGVISLIVILVLIIIATAILNPDFSFFALVHKATAPTSQ